MRFIGAVSRHRRRFKSHRPRNSHSHDEDLAVILRDIVMSTGCNIVLSTFWRPFLFYLRYVLHRYGIPASRVIGRTPGGSGAVRASAEDEEGYVNRAAEIEAWLVAHPSVSRFAILDDRSSASNESLAPHFVQTTSSIGITSSDAARCKSLLGLPSRV